MFALALQLNTFIVSLFPWCEKSENSFLSTHIERICAVYDLGHNSTYNSSRREKFWRVSLAEDGSLRIHYGVWTASYIPYANFDIASY